MTDSGHTKLLLLVFQILQHCWADHNFDPRIVGGQYAELGAAPYIVLLRDLNGNPHCAGTIIRANWIITARHCLRATIAEVLAGFVDENETNEAQVRQISQSFRSTKGDIALLKLVAPFDLNSENVAKIELPKPDYKVNGVLEIYGWGNSGQRKWESKLKSASLPSVDDHKCVKMFSKSSIRIIPAKTFCAGSTNGDLGACHGDSGGPLVKLAGDTPILVGVVQGGSKTCMEKRKPTFGFLDASPTIWPGSRQL